MVDSRRGDRSDEPRRVLHAHRRGVEVLIGPIRAPITDFGGMQWPPHAWEKQRQFSRRC